MSAAETGQMSAVGTRQMSTIATGQRLRSSLEASTEVLAGSRRWAQFRQGRGGDSYLPPETLFLRSLGRTAGGVEKTDHNRREDRIGDHTPRLVTPEGVGG